MAANRRLIPDPQGAVEFVSASGVVMVPDVSNDPVHSNLDNFAGPWSKNTWMEQFGNGSADLGLGPNAPSRKLVGKMKCGC